MEMMNISSQQQINMTESNSRKQEAIVGVFESVLKSIAPEKEKTDGEKEEKSAELSSYMFMGESILVLEKGITPEMKVDEHLSLKAPVEVLNQTSAKIVLPDVNIQKEIPKDLIVKRGFSKELVSEMTSEIKNIDKTREVLIKDIGVKEKTDEGFKLVKEAKVFSVAYRELNYSQKPDGVKAEKVVIIGKSAEKLSESNIKSSPNMEKNQQVAAFTVESMETSLRVETEAPILKNSQDNILKVQDAMIQLFETTREGETTRMSVSLHPKNLGKVDIGLKMEGGKLTASIVVESNQVRDLFTNKLSELNQSLAKQNLLIEKIHIEVKNNGTNLQMNMNQQGNFNQQGRRHQENRMNNVFKSEYQNFKEIESITFEKGVSILA